MGFDFESGAMVLTILILSSNLMVSWGSDWMVNEIGDPLNITDPNANYVYDLNSIIADVNSLQPASSIDTNNPVSVFTSPLTIAFAYMGSGINAFQQSGRLVWNLFTGTQQALLFIAVPLGSAAIAFAWVIIGIISSIEIFGVTYFIIRFISLVRRGGGVG